MGEGESDRRKRGRKKEIIFEKEREERKRNLSSRRKFPSRERNIRAVVEDSKEEKERLREKRKKRERS